MAAAAAQLLLAAAAVAGGVCVYVGHIAQGDGDPADVRGVEGQVRQGLRLHRRGGVPVRGVQGDPPRRRPAQRRLPLVPRRPQHVRRPHRRRCPPPPPPGCVLGEKEAELIQQGLARLHPL